MFISMLRKSTFTCALALLFNTAYASKPLLEVSELLEVAELRYYGVCDGSAAVRLDEQTLLVANDENNVLISYNIWGGKPIASVDLATVLSNLKSKDGKIRELDLEAATILGDKIWWVASHGPNKSGKERPNRRSFFSTNKPDRNLQVLDIIDTRVDLAPILIASPKTQQLITKEILSTPPKQGGLNIEAMAFTPTGKLLIGLRSPLNGDKGMKGEATLITLENTHGRWHVNHATELDLNNKGIRDLIPFRSGYLVIAGKVKSGGTFALHSLSHEFKPLRITKFKPETLNPEALVALNTQLLVLSDDGNEPRNNKADETNDRNCKAIMGDNIDAPSDDPRVFFRGAVFDLSQHPFAVGEYQP